MLGGIAAWIVDLSLPALRPFSEEMVAWQAAEGSWSFIGKFSRDNLLRILEAPHLMFLFCNSAAF